MSELEKIRETRIIGLTDAIDYYWNLSIEHKLCNDQIEDLRNLGELIRCHGEVGEKWYKLSLEIIEKNSNLF